ncbi:MAG TPA: hypothetical protein VE760_06815, partial [Acidimicrobiales bacterium]|nr:hypothetical protein [Acidimicrobiales bacterium]
MGGVRLRSSRPPPVRAPADDPTRETPGRPVAPAGAPAPAPAPRARGLRLPRFGLRPLDALLPVALALWIIGVQAVDPRAMDDYGLLPALPLVFLVAVALLVGSTAVVLSRAELSPVRLALHLVALVLFLHGTVPLVFSQPIFPWVYKHVGVVGYLDLHGALDPRVDIYQNWPGFFALAAWFTRIAGLHSPLVYAAWAPVYFNLLICVELGFVFRSLPVTRRVRWLAAFVFVAGNWVGQDYFAPQAMAFVLSLAVFGVVLAWFRADRPPAPVRAVRRLSARLASTPQEPGPGWEGAAPAPDVSRLVALSVLFFTFTVIVVTHQLSPYVIILSLGLLTVAGLVRPRWVVVGLAAVAVGYLLLHFSYVERTQDLFGSVGDPLGNAQGTPDDSVPMAGRRLTTLAAPALIAGLWMLGTIGAVRRLRGRRPTLILALLSGAPVLILLGQSYGGEAVFRIYLFSLPWIAVLAASALEPRLGRWGWTTAATAGVVLAVELALFMSAFYGSLELYQVRPGEVEASRYFYANAEPGSVLTLGAPNFPTRLGERYDEFAGTGDNPPNLLTTVNRFRHRMLGPDDLPAVAEFAGEYVGATGGGRYLALGKGQQVYADVLGLLPGGSFSRLDRALAASPDWRVYYRNADAVIYRLLRPPLAERAGSRPAPAPAPARARAPVGFRPVPRAGAA